MKGLPRAGKAVLGAGAAAVLLLAVALLLDSVTSSPNCGPTPPAQVAAAVLGLVSLGLALGSALAAFVLALARRRERRLFYVCVTAVALMPFVAVLDAFTILVSGSWCFQF